MESIPGTNDKLDVLRENKDNVELQTVFFLAYNPKFKYFMTSKTFPEIENYGVPRCTMVTLEKICRKLHSREITGNAARDAVRTWSETFSEESAIILKRIILGDLKVGVSAKGANKVWNGLILEKLYMRCSGLEKLKNITYPAVAQTKADGIFCNIVVENGEVSFLTRSNTLLELESWGQKFKLLNVDNVVYHGEITILGEDGEILDRKTGNGLLNKIGKRNQTQESFEAKLETATGKKLVQLTAKHKIHLAELEEIESNCIIDLWDMVDLDGWMKGKDETPYKVRFTNLQNTLSSPANVDLEAIDTRTVNSEEEAFAFYEEQLANGKEGSVLKNENSPWKNGTSTQQIKFKEIKDCDLRVVRHYMGEKGSEIEMGIGGLELISSCGKLKVNVGSGLSRKERGLELINPNDSSSGLKVIDGFVFNQYDDKIVATKFNELVDSESKETKSLFLPRIVEIRDDKTEADSLAHIETL